MAKLWVELHWRALYFTTTRIAMVSCEAATFDDLDRGGDHVDALQRCTTLRRHSGNPTMFLLDISIYVKWWRQKLLLDFFGPAVS